MDLEKIIQLIFKDLRNNAMTHRDYVYNTEKTHQIIRKHLTEQLKLYSVVSSSDEVVVELSDNELKIIRYPELEQWQKDALEFDGFEGWIVKGRLVKGF